MTEGKGRNLTEDMALQILSSVSLDVSTSAAFEDLKYFCNSPYINSLFCGSFLHSLNWIS